MTILARSFRSLIIASGFALPVVTSTASAQSESTGASGFISTRYSNATSDFIFAGYGRGDYFGLAGLVHNPRSGYNEVLAGLGVFFTTAAWNRNALAVAYSEATDSPYLQIFLLPSITLGGTIAEATLQLYAPGSSVGVWQVGVNPVSVVTQVVGPFSLGASYQMAAQEHTLPRHMAGPTFRFAIPNGVVSLELFEGLKRYHDEIRISLRANF